MSVHVYTAIKVAWERNDTEHPTQHRLCRTYNILTFSYAVS